MQNQVNEDARSAKDRQSGPLLIQTEHFSRRETILAGLGCIAVVLVGVVAIANPLDVVKTPAAAVVIIVGLGGLRVVGVPLRHGNPDWRKNRRQNESG